MKTRRPLPYEIRPLQADPDRLRALPSPRSTRSVERVLVDLARSGPSGWRTAARVLRDAAAGTDGHARRDGLTSIALLFEARLHPDDHYLRRQQHEIEARKARRTRSASQRLRDLDRFSRHTSTVSRRYH